MSTRNEPKLEFLTQSRCRSASYGLTRVAACLTSLRLKKRFLLFFSGEETEAFPTLKTFWVFRAESRPVPGEQA